jgi:hypothetical protein
MEQQICNEIGRFVGESAANHFPECDRPYFDAPLVGFASAGDPLFAEYKGIIGEFRW